MIEIKNLEVGYGDKTVISISQHRIEKGETTIISGNSGSGKTTLLYALAGFSKNIIGNIFINNENLYELDECQRDKLRGKQIGIVFQTLHLVKSLNVFQNLLLAPFVNDEQQENSYIEYLMERLGIVELKNKFVTNISQGQAQRVAIARALLAKPAILLADEPTSSLDDTSAEQVINLLKELSKENETTLIVATHDNRIKDAFSKKILLGDKNEKI
ncbi:MAG: ATP-binding cassette domain-containing protein [Rickettsiales bacterium]|nr:ATP-binding cassette domain-containing protein [Rickettsiales bacterium]